VKSFKSRLFKKEFLKASLAASGPDYVVVDVVDMVNTEVGVLWVFEIPGPDLQFTVPDVAVLLRSVWVCSHEY